MGYDVDFGYSRSFNDVISKNGYEYPFKNVLDIFKNDDVTVVNLETTFTDAEKRAVKEFRFRGEPGYAEILGMSSIEAVNIANNHTHDYLEEGFKDTIDNLKSASIGYFGKDYKYIKEVKGVKLGFLGYTGWSDSRSVRDTIYSDIQELKGQCRIVVVSFHWGTERMNYPNTTQQNLGRFCIDSGADLVLGHHPHVIQGIETYKGKNIVYSMGNFSYGGHKNPADKDTFIFKARFRISGKEVYPVDSEIIPCSISSTKSYNNYQPTPLSGSDGERVINRLKQYSSALEFGYKFK
jgi:poly-gamma-glutamate synthesis protein (capsule biosynthesis protein)